MKQEEFITILRYARNLDINPADAFFNWGDFYLTRRKKAFRRTIDYIYREYESKGRR